jgi:hypothetical protein
MGVALGGMGISGNVITRSVFFHQHRIHLAVFPSQMRTANSLVRPVEQFVLNSKPIYTPK